MSDSDDDTGRKRPGLKAVRDCGRRFEAPGESMGQPKLRVVHEAEHEEETPVDNDEKRGRVPAHELIEIMAESLMTQLPQALLFAPSFPVERLPEVARFIAAEQYKINTEILPRMADPTEPKPRIALKFTTMPNSQAESAMPRPGVVIESMRRLEGITDPGDACRMAFIYAFFDSPVARAILRMNQYAYDFSFVGEEPPRIIIT